VLDKLGNDSMDWVEVMDDGEWVQHDDKDSVILLLFKMHEKWQLQMLFLVPHTSEGVAHCCDGWVWCLVASWLNFSG